MLSKQAKQKVITTSKLHKEDSGSAQVQVSLLSVRIQKLTEHLKKNKKDNHSRRGLLKLVAHRKKLIRYLKNTDSKMLEKLADKYKFKV
ncbi:MAG: 30S ribosomal protein S15 [Candidatus Moranbacteria bacterium]|nr:30S ribosomal protein S15 [Candidatus Moranbacteria bacterium]